MNKKQFFLALISLTITSLLISGCGGTSTSNKSSSDVSSLKGKITADGSSTVGPLTSLAAEEFRMNNSEVQITVGISGSGGGFERFCAGETDLSNASRAITPEEIEACEAAGIEYTEFAVATDALTVVVNPENDFVNCLSIEQLSTIWAPESEGQITNWNQVDPSFPDLKISLAGPGTDSGTFDYFTDVVNGDEGASRADYTPSEDDNVIVQSVTGSKGGHGYFGFSYWAENPGAIKALEIDGGNGCVAPGIETALTGDYSPLSRPLLLYAKNSSFARIEVQEFIRFYLENAPQIAEAALYVPLSNEQQEAALSIFDQAVASIE
tara:strand:- start:1000 stop:1971 length:972 start_codon:yes stop_codon:yes gene_type:complete